MADQKIKLQVSGDTSELMAALDAVVKRTQQAQNQLKALNTSPKSQAPVVSPEEKKYQQVLGDVKKDEERARINRNAQDIARRQLQDIRREIESNGRAETKNEKDREQAQRNINRLKEDERRIAETLNRLQGKTGSGTIPPGARANPASAMGQGGITSASGLAMALGAPAMAIGAIATAAFALKAGESIRKAIFEAQYETRAISTQAFNTKGQGGQLLESAINGNGLEDIMFARERAKGQSTGSGLVERTYGAVGGRNPLMVGAVGGLGGSLALGALNYLSPEYGGRAMNSIGALEHGQFAQAGNAMFFPERYQARIALEKGQEGLTQTEIEKNAAENKGSTAIKEQYIQDFQRNLAFQRQTGMTVPDLLRNRECQPLLQSFQLGVAPGMLETTLLLHSRWADNST